MSKIVLIFEVKYDVISSVRKIIV